MITRLLAEPLVMDDWRADSACLGIADPDVFFAEDPTSERAAKLLCRSCPVRAKCLNFALDLKIKDGVWGGLTREERTRIATPRIRVKCPVCQSQHIFVSDTSTLCLLCGVSWQSVQNSWLVD